MSTTPTDRPTDRPRRTARSGAPRRPSHLRAALTALALAATVLPGLQLYAADGITAARRAALQSARTGAPAHAYSTPSSDASSDAPRTEGAAPSDGASAAQPGQAGHEGGRQPPVPGRTTPSQDSVRTGTRAAWVTRDTHVPYSRDDPSATPLALPACTASPTTPMPCLAWNSADSAHAVVLEEDGSLTGLVRQ